MAGLDTSAPPAAVVPETRTTPWGVQTYNESLSIWQPYHPNVAIHGLWLEDREVPQQCKSCGRPTHCQSHDKPKITVPTKALLSAFRAPGTALGVANDAKTHAPPKRSKGRCVILDLPPELMRQILDYLVPSGCAYQFIPCKDQKRPVQVVQKFTPLEASLGSISAHLAMAATCKDLNKLIYSILYGENEFAFNISAAAVRAHTRAGNYRHFESWSRILRQEPGPSGPISARSAAHLKYVTLMVLLPINHGTKEVMALRAVVAKVADILSEANDLQDLTIDLHLPTREARNDETLKVDRLHLRIEERTKRCELSLRELKNEPPQRRAGKAQPVLQPLFALRGVKTLTLSGPVTDEFAAELRESVTASV